MNILLINSPFVRTILEFLSNTVRYVINCEYLSNWLISIWAMRKMCSIFTIFFYVSMNLFPETVYAASVKRIIINQLPSIFKFMLKHHFPYMSINNVTVSKLNKYKKLFQSIHISIHASSRLYASLVCIFVQPCCHS